MRSLRPNLPQPGHYAGLRYQSGAVLLVLMIAIVLVGSTALLAKLNGTAKFQVHLDRETAEALAEAKAALIGYAVSDASRPGELPCPDANHDGFSKVPEDYSGPNCTNLRGWLPWKTLELPEMRDGSGEHLWYALSDRYHAGDPLPLNSETAGQVIVDGSPPRRGGRRGHSTGPPIPEPEQPTRNRERRH